MFRIGKVQPDPGVVGYFQACGKLNWLLWPFGLVYPPTWNAVSIPPVYSIGNWVSLKCSYHTFTRWGPKWGRFLTLNIQIMLIYSFSEIFLLYNLIFVSYFLWFSYQLFHFMSTSNLPEKLEGRVVFPF